MKFKKYFQIFKTEIENFILKKNNELLQNIRLLLITVL